MRILFLVPNPIGTIPGQRFRFEQYLSFLVEREIDYKICHFVSSSFHKILYKKGHIFKKCLYTLAGFLYRVINLVQSLNYDLIFIYREITPLGPPIFERILHLMGKPIIFDFDDAIYLPSCSEANKFIAWLKFPKKTEYIIKLSTLVLVGNKNLQKYALRFNDNVSILPTAINTDIYKPKKIQLKEKICVGWSGSRTTIAYLSLLKEVLRKIYLEYNINIKIIGSKNFSIDGVKISALDWKLGTELEDLTQLDIGLMPLPDDAWGKGKCGLKALQYMALGIPAVCSPVGLNIEIINDGINGFLCRDETEWINKISLLIKNPELREKIGRAGRVTVEEKYSVKVNAPKYMSAITSVYEQRMKKKCAEFAGS